MIQAVRRNAGGVIEAHFLGARPTSVTVSVFTNKAVAKVTAQAATLNSVNTTISAQALKGALSVDVTSAASIVVGRRYLLGTTNGAEAPEAVSVKRVIGATVSLWAPLMSDHSSGAAFAGTRASYAVSGGQADATWFDGYADWTATGGTGETLTEVVECWLRPVPPNLIDETYVRSVLANAHQILPATLDMPLALLEARDELLRRMGGKNRVHAVMGLDHLRRLCALVFWQLRRYELGDNYERIMDKMGEELSIGLSSIPLQIPFDNNQDGKTDGATDGGYNTRETGKSM